MLQLLVEKLYNLNEIEDHLTNLLCFQVISRNLLIMYLLLLQMLTNQKQMMRLWMEQIWLSGKKQYNRNSTHCSKTKHGIWLTYLMEEM